MVCNERENVEVLQIEAAGGVQMCVDVEVLRSRAKPCFGSVLQISCFPHHESPHRAVIHRVIRRDLFSIKVQIKELEKALTAKAPNITCFSLSCKLPCCVWHASCDIFNPTCS